MSSFMTQSTGIESYDWTGSTSVRHLSGRLRRLNSDEEWHHGRYTELEANVETEGRRRFRPFWTKTRDFAANVPYRERSDAARKL